MKQDKAKPKSENKSESKTDSPMAHAMAGNSPAVVEQDPVVEKAKQRQEVAKAEAMESKAVQESAKTQELTAQLYGPMMGMSQDDLMAAQERIRNQLGQKSAYAPAIDNFLQQQMALASGTAKDLKTELDKPEAGFFESLLGGVLNVGTLGLVETSDLFDVQDEGRLNTLKRDYYQQAQIAGPLIREAMGFANERDKLQLQNAYSDAKLAKQRMAGIQAHMLEQASERDKEARQKQYESEKLSATEEMQKRMIDYEVNAREASKEKDRATQLTIAGMRSSGSGKTSDKAIERVNSIQLGKTDAVREFVGTPVKGEMAAEVHAHAADLVSKLVRKQEVTPIEQAALFTNLLKIHSDPGLVMDHLNNVLDAGITAVQGGSERAKSLGSLDEFRESGRNSVIEAANAVRMDFQRFVQDRMAQAVQIDKDTRVYNTPAAKANMMFDTLNIKHPGFDLDESVYAAVNGQTRDGRPVTDAYFKRAVANNLGSFPVDETTLRSKVAAWTDEKAFLYRLKDWNARELESVNSLIHRAATDFFGGKEGVKNLGIGGWRKANALKKAGVPESMVKHNSPEEKRKQWAALGALYLADNPAFAIQVLEKKDKDLNSKNPSWAYRNLYTDWLHVKAFLDSLGIKKIEDIPEKLK